MANCAKGYPEQGANCQPNHYRNKFAQCSGGLPRSGSLEITPASVARVKLAMSIPLFGISREDLGCLNRHAKSSILAAIKRPSLTPHDWFSKRIMIAAMVGAALAASARSSHADTPSVRIGYIRWTEPQPAILLLDKAPPDNGLAGARLGVSDNNTTGRFMNRQFEILDAPLDVGDDPSGRLKAQGSEGIALVLTDVPVDRLLALTASGRAVGTTIFNIRASDDALRQQDCRENVIHVAPPRSMLADALGQYLVWKKWSRWVLAYGSHSEDWLLADAYRRSAMRFGASIVKELEFKGIGGARQTDSDGCRCSSKYRSSRRAARARRAHRGRRERSVRELFAVSHLGCAASRRFRRAAARELGSEQRVLGRYATAGPLRSYGASAYDRARYAGPDRVPHDRRSRQPRRVDRLGRYHARNETGGVRHHRLQGAETQPA
jgi:hypothetical protein